MKFTAVIKFLKKTSIIIGVINLIVHFLTILIMWIEGIKGYYFFVFPIVFLLIYSLVIFNILRNLKSNLFDPLKLLTIGLLCWIAYINIDFIYSVLINNGYYPCELGASCP